MKLKIAFTTLLLISAILGAKAQTSREQRRSQMDSLLRIGRAECFMLKVDLEAYLQKVSMSADSFKEAHIMFLSEAFPFLKKQISSINDLNKLCDDPLLRNEFISLAQDVVADYWKRKAVMIEMRYLSE
jgi:hypothetical protein